jgi:hypothetical protein
MSNVATLTPCCRSWRPRRGHGREPAPLGVSGVDRGQSGLHAADRDGSRTPSPTHGPRAAPNHAPTGFLLNLAGVAVILLVNAVFAPAVLG